MSARTAVPLLEAAGITKRFGGFTALNGVDIAVQPGDRVGIIGPNGSGKTTLMNCIAGLLRADEGSVRLAGEEIGQRPPWQRARLGIARSFQIPRPFAGMSVEENLLVPLDFNGRLPAADKAKRIGSLLAEFSLEPRRKTLTRELTQVELRKLELARAVAGSPRLLISDEAMAGLSVSEIDEVLVILDRLADGGIAVLMVEHMMRAIMSFSARVVCLDAGRVIASGSPQDVTNHPDVRRAYLGA